MNPVLPEEGQNLLVQLLTKYMTLTVKVPSLLKIWIVPAASSLSFCAPHARAWRPTDLSTHVFAPDVAPTHPFFHQKYFIFSESSTHFIITVLFSRLVLKWLPKNTLCVHAVLCVVEAYSKSLTPRYRIITKAIASSKNITQCSVHFCRYIVLHKSPTEMKAIFSTNNCY